MEQPTEPTATPEPIETPEPEAKEEVQAVEETQEVSTEEPKRDLLGDDAPDWMKRFDARGDNWEPSAADLESLSPEAQRVLNAMYRKSTSLGESYKQRESELDARQRSLEDAQSMLSEERLRMYKLLQDDEARNAVAAPEGEAPDPFTPEGMAFLVQQEVAKRMQTYFKQLDSNISKQQEEYNQVKQKAATEARVVELKAFAKKNPDFVKLKQEIVDLRKSMNNAISAEDAYVLIKAKRGETVERASTTNGVDESRKRARQANGRGSSFPKGKSGPPEGASAIEIMRYYREHPDEMERDYAKRIKQYR